MQQLYHRELGEGDPLIILHGLFGTSDNWLTLGRRYAEKHKVYLLDQRNHGQSFHDDDFSYEAMATDLERFMTHYKIEEANLLGHSMGGKTAMTFATTRPQRVKKLIVADMGPQFYPVRHHAILKALFSIDLKNLYSRKEADEKLGELIPETGIRQFLLKNLARTPEGFGWKMNLPVIASEIEQVGKGLNQNSSYKQPALFIRGGRSDYIRDTDLNLIHSIFGNSEVKTLEGAGHWLHAEKPRAFFDITTQFLQ